MDGEAMKSPAICEKSPTQRHVYSCYWQDGHYYSKCKWCGYKKEEDANLGERPYNTWPFRKVDNGA